MGIFGGYRGYSGRNRQLEDEMYRNQEEQRRINEKFRQETLKRQEEARQVQEKFNEEINRLSEEIRLLRVENRNLRNSQDAEMKRRKIDNDLAMQVKKNQIEEIQREKEEKESLTVMSEREYQEAKKRVEIIKKQLGEYLRKKNMTAIERLEEKLKKDLLIFKKEYSEGKKNLDKEALQVKEMIYEIGNFYYQNENYEKAIYYFVEYQGFIANNHKKNILKKLIHSAYECGRYEELKSYLENYQEENKTEEYLVKFQSYLKIKDLESVKVYIEKLEEQFLEKNNTILKLYWEKYISLLENYCLEYPEEKYIRYLYFLLLHEKHIFKIECLLKEFPVISDTEFFEGIVALKKKDSTLAKEKIKNYLGTIHGDLYYLDIVKDDIKKEDIGVLERYLSYDLQEIVSEFYCIESSFLLKKKYEFLVAKLKLFMQEKQGNIESYIENIQKLLEEDPRPIKEKGNNVLWIQLLEMQEYFEKISSPVSYKISEVINKHLEEDEIEKLKEGLGEIPDIDIANEYIIGDIKNELSYYKDMQCENRSTGDSKIYIEIIETMNKNRRLEKKLALQEDQKLSKRNEYFLKINNFCIEDNKIQIITEDYDSLYEEHKNQFFTMTFSQKIQEAYKLISLFQELEKEKLYFNKLNIDNLVIQNEKYCLRFIHYTNTNSNGSLSSSYSAVAKKSNSYKSPENVKSTIGMESNIYILGFLFHDIFYGYHILTGLIKENMSLLEQDKVRNAFATGEEIERNLVNHNPKERLKIKSPEKDTVELRRTLEKYYVPKSITSLIERMTSPEKSARESLEEIKQNLQDIEVDCEEYDGYIPNYFIKRDLKEVLKKMAKDIRTVTIREESLHYISSKTKFDENADALIVLDMEDGNTYQVSESGDYYVLLKKEKITDNKYSEIEIKERLDKILEEEGYAEYSEKYHISEREIQILFFSLQNILNTYFKVGILELKGEEHIKETLEKMVNEKIEIKTLFSNLDVGILFHIIDQII